MRIFGYEISRDSIDHNNELKSKYYPQLVVPNHHGHIDTIDQWQIAFHDIMYSIDPVKTAWDNASFWSKLKFRWAFFVNPLNMISIVMGTHTKEFVTDINKRILELKGELP